MKRLVLILVVLAALIGCEQSTEPTDDTPPALSTSTLADSLAEYLLGWWDYVGYRKSDGSFEHTYGSTTLYRADSTGYETNNESTTEMLSWWFQNETTTAHIGDSLDIEYYQLRCIYETSPDTFEYRIRIAPPDTIYWYIWFLGIEEGVSVRM